MTYTTVRSAFHRNVLRYANLCENTFVIDELGIKNAYNLLGGIIEWNGDIV